MATAKKPTVKKQEKSISKFIVPVQLQRIRQSVLTWRDAAAESERAYWPYRVKMQQLFLDTDLNGHVTACVEKRKNLTLLRKFAFKAKPDDTSAELPDITAMFAGKEWFNNFLSHALDALFYGYSLVSLGDIINSEISKVDTIKRWNISPDRLNVTSFLYATSGIQFTEDPQYADWYCWVSTPGNNGISECGYGLYYKIAIYEIFCRNILGFNGDFVEMFSQPYRVGKTLKTEGVERDDFEAAIRDMGSAGYAIIDPGDDIAFLEAIKAGTGWNGYDNLEKRCEQKISKVILGHADAIDSIPGKLGNNDVKSPATKAQEEIQTKDGQFAENIINGILLPKMRALGLPIPDGGIYFKNDAEKQEIRTEEDKANLGTAAIALDMAQAGLQMDAKYFTKRTGIECTVIEKPASVLPGANPGLPASKPSKKKNDLPKGVAKFKEKLKALYS